ncbi:FAD-binding domain containing protein [Naviculisporaceae sp. PSN 640]
MAHIRSLLLKAALLLAPLSAQAAPECKAVPGSPDWPSPETWQLLNETTGGRLFAPTPPGAACHPGQASYNAAECRRVQLGWSTYEFHGEDPVSVDWNQWNNDTCLPVPGLPCSPKGYPAFVLNATTPEHVKAGVDFAREHNIRLIVKSSGHDFLGRSTAPNSLSIWLHHMQWIKPVDVFRPKNCADDVAIENAVTVGGGTQMYSIYQATGKYNRTVVGGGAKTVSVGGFLTGGGHGLLAPRYGLGADQVLEMEVVTPGGEILTVNECQNTDLFWALRGGGGSTFGVVTSVTTKTYPTPSISHVEFALLTSETNNPSLFEMIAYIHSQFPLLGDAGLSGYAFFFQAIPNPSDGGVSQIGGITMTGIFQDIPTTKAEQLMAPIFTHIDKTWPGLFYPVFKTTPYKSFLDWYNVNYDNSAAGTNSLTGSRLLDKSSLTGNLTLTAEVFKTFTNVEHPGGMGTAYLVSGKGVHNAVPRGGSNAVLPAWRKAYVHATLVSASAFGVGFAPLNATSRADAMKRINRALEPMRKLAPDSGAYANEATPEEPDWQNQFWGSNYKRLAEIKRRVDPTDVFWCHPCVGNEGWQEVEDQLCRI